MRRVAAILALYVTVVVWASALPLKPTVLVQVRVAPQLGLQGKDAASRVYANVVALHLCKQLPCVSCITPDEIRELIGFARMRALLGVPADQEAAYEQSLEGMGDAVGADYLVDISAIAVDAGWYVSGMWLDMRKAGTMARYGQTLAKDANLLAAVMRTVVDRLVEQVEYFEICAYSGPIKIQRHSYRSSSSHEERTTFCQGGDQQYTKDHSLERRADLQLDLVRNGRPWARGGVDFVSVETEDTEELDPCHPCPSGARAFRLYTEHKRTEVRINGFSTESSALDHELMDVKVHLKFAKNGTFRLEVVGATQTGSKRVKVQRKAEGNCDTTFAKPNEDSTAKFDIPIAYVFGPFQGSPSDKELCVKQEYHTTDPGTKEETTISVDFVLRRP